MFRLRHLLAVALGVLASACQAQWNMPFDGSSHLDDTASLMVSDSAGNVYVTGASNGGASKKDTVTIKYDPNGNVLWTRIFNGINEDDAPYGLAVDSQGNVYVASTYGLGSGESYVIFIKYTSSGADAWSRSWNLGHVGAKPVGFSVDAQDNPYWLANGQPDQGTPTFYLYKMIKESGYAYWGKPYNFGNLGDTGTCLKVDPDGSTIVSAIAPGSNGRNRIAILKHDTSGALLWKYFYVPVGGDAVPNAVTTDAAHNVYFTGYQSVGTGEHDVVTGKLSPNGTLLWSKVYDGPDHFTDEGNAISVGPKGDVYVVGTTSTANDFNDILTLKYSSDGLSVTAKNLDLMKRDDYGTAIDVDSANRVYVLGIGRNTLNKPDFDLVRAIYNGSTMSLVNTSTTGGGNLDNLGVAIKSDSKGHLFHTGSTTSVANGWNFLTTMEILPPTTVANAYYVNYTDQLSVPVTSGLLANDIYAVGGTAQLDTTTSQGVLSLQSNGTFTYTPGNFFGTDSFTYHARREGLNGNVSSVKLTVVPALSSLSANPSPVQGGTNSVGTVHLNHVVGAVAPTISCSSSKPSVASVPATFTVATGLTSKTFTITTHPVAVDTDVVITTKWNGITKAIILKVTP